MKTVLAFLTLLAINSTAFAGAKSECLEDIRQKSLALFSEQVGQEAIAGDIQASSTERSAAIGNAGRLHWERLKLLNLVDAIISQSESAEGFNCPTK